MYSFAIMMCEIVMTYMQHLPGKRDAYKGDRDHSQLLADAGKRLGVMCPSLGVVLAACGERDPRRRMTAQAALCILKDTAVELNPPPVVPVDQVRAVECMSASVWCGVLMCIVTSACVAPSMLSWHHAALRGGHSAVEGTAGVCVFEFAYGMHCAPCCMCSNVAFARYV